MSEPIGYLVDSPGWKGKVIWNEAGRRMLREIEERRSARDAEERHLAAVRRIGEKLLDYRRRNPK